MKRVVLLGIAVLAVGCAPVTQQSNVSQPIGRSMTAGIGDVVLRVEGRESMPNAFGRADIFGRTRPTGFTTIQFGGLQGGKVVLLRNGVITQSDATTMNSTGMIVPTQQSTTVYGNVNGAPVSATATTSGTAYIPPSGSTQTSVGQGTIPILVDWKTSPTVAAMGKNIVIEAATSTALTYRIED